MSNERPDRKIAVLGEGGLYREWTFGQEGGDGSEHRVAGIPLQDDQLEEAV